jgi:pimeloyl-ACP methyl ester carboxylesterase
MRTPGTTRCWPALAVCVLLASPAVAGEGAPFDPLSADPAAGEHPGQMVELSIPSDGAQLYGVFYRAAGSAPHATIALLHGFAGFEQNEDLAQVMRRAGFNVLIFHYRGAWGSTGSFSFSHCIEDTAAVLTYLRAPANAERLGIDPQRLILIGHSVGGHIAGLVAARDPAVAGVAMISAANRRLAMARPDWETVTQARYATEIGPLRGTQAQTLVAELRRHARDWDLVPLAARWQGRPVLVVSADDLFADEDAAIVAAARAANPQHLTAVHLATDHAYSGARVALARALLAWLGQFSAPP